MIDAVIDQYPTTFARLDMVKIAAYVKGTSTEPVNDGDDHLWILGEPLTLTVTHRGDTVGQITVPAGFITDGASVPRLAQILTGWRPWDEPQRWAAIAHDWLYCCNGHLDQGQPAVAVAKSYADRTFRAVLRAAGAHRLRYTAMYWAVHLFGGHAYRADQATGPTIRT